MRVVLDTNIVVSALIAPRGVPASIYDALARRPVHPSHLRRTA
jgi:predicted nucleic acid-binding protein